MQAFLFIVLLLFFYWLSRRLLFGTQPFLAQKFFLPLLSLQILAGWAMGYLYVAYYPGGDTWVYFHDISVLSNLFWKDANIYSKVVFQQTELAELYFANQPRALFFVKTGSLLGVFCLDNYWLLSMTFSIVSFLASWWFAARLKQHLKCKDYQVIFPFLVFPSVIFWSSGVLKETLAISMIFLLSGIFLNLYFNPKKNSQRIYFQTIIGIGISFLLWKLKYYYAAILLPILSAALLLKWLDSLLDAKHLQAKKNWFLPIITIAMVAVPMQLHPNLELQYVLSALFKNHQLSVSASLPDTYVLFPTYDDSVASFLIHFPKAVLNGLFAPMPLVQGANSLHLIAGIENLIVLMLVSCAIVVQIMRNKRPAHLVLIVLCVLYIVVLAGLITLASPNFGSLLRYRVAYLPFLLFLTLLSLDDNLRTILSQFRKKI